MAIFKNIAAVLAGIVLGSTVNMGLIMAGSVIIPPPAGVDPANMESIKANMHLFQAQHFLFPFLAHALGTLAGAIAAVLIAANRKNLFAWIVGAAFLLGGIINAFMLPAPIWFIAADLILAYIPTAYAAIKLASASRV